MTTSQRDSDEEAPDPVEYDAWTIWRIARGNPEAMALAMQMLNDEEEEDE